MQKKSYFKKNILKPFLVFSLVFLAWFSFYFDKNLDQAHTDIKSSNYTIKTQDIVPWTTYKTTNRDTKKRVNDSLLVIIQKIFIPLWVLSAFVMAIWAGYMILSSWQDEVLNKGKKIFKMWIFAVVIALISYLLVELVKYLLYY